MEKFMRKMWKKSEGFTLVELIVVIAILGILAAVAVPAYTGYINKANEAADMQVLSSVATAVAGVLAADGQEVSQIVVTKSTGNVQYKIASGNLTDATSEMWKLMGVANATALKSEFSTKSTWTTATMQGGDWTLAY